MDARRKEVLIQEFPDDTFAVWINGDGPFFEGTSMSIDDIMRVLDALHPNIYASCLDKDFHV